jgi:hypothetical protein
MKNHDKFLLGIVVAVVILIIAAFTVTLTRPEAAYQPEDQPEGVAFNYLFALQQENYGRAFTYLSPDLTGRPRNSSEFMKNLNKSSWEMRRIQDGESVSLEVISVSTTGNSSIVKLKSTRFYQRGLFDSGESSSTFDMHLQKDSHGAWKITKSGSYWASCWHLGGCK